MDKVLGWFLVSTAMFASAVVFAIAWRNARARAIRAEALIDRMLGEGAATNEVRTDRLENAVEAIAGELERVRNGQSDVVRLLGERTLQHDQQRAAIPVRAITPH